MKKIIKNNMGAILKTLVGVIYICPILLGVLFAFQTNRDILMDPFELISDNPTLENFVYALKNIPILMYLKNTMIVILIEVPIRLLIGAMSAFAFSFYEFPGKNFLFAVVLSCMMIPGEVTAVANFATVQRMGLFNTYAGLTIIGLSGIGAMFMLRQHMRSLPRELWEAARMDGCGEMKYFATVILPLSVPVLASQAITGFISSFNSYFWPMTITNTDEMRTIQVGVAQLMASSSNTYGYVLAAAVLCMIIPIIAYLFGQKYIIKGMTAGAVKS